MPASAGMTVMYPEEREGFPSQGVVPLRIAIIGAGFCGVALARELAHTVAPGTRIALIGNAESFARGIAYATPRPEHCLNVRARDMGIDPENPAGFADWLELEGAEREGFQPRTRFGDYLRATLDDAVTHAAARGVELETISAHVTAMQRTPHGFRLHLAGGEHLDATRVVLAPGALPPQPMAGLSPELLGSPRYVPAPFAHGALDRIPTDARVFVIGTGLTFADVAISLRRNGHRGAIEAVSRHGFAPLPHTIHPSPPAPLPPALQQTIDHGDLHGMVRHLRCAVREVDDWRRLIDALRPHLQPLWQRFSERDRAQFLRHLRSYWEIHRHRIAPPLMDELDAMRASGQLVIAASRLQHAELIGEHVYLALRDRGAAQPRHVEVDALIRAIGLDTDVVRTDHALIASLRDAGLIHPAAFGLGLETDTDFSVLDQHRQPVPGLYALGPLLRGRLWEITAVPELRRAAIALAGVLCRTRQAEA